ncbi:ubiquitin-fold modifier-conjugating enzyme 1 [Trichonephila clavipes]|nr:ubiquitin-fold modifier-conjugating enzyme 1 [Trichonephila clavipes]
MLEKVIENWTSRLDYIRASRGSPMPEIMFKIITFQLCSSNSTHIPYVNMVDEGTRKTLSKIPLLKTKAGPRDKELWPIRLKEEYQALIQYVQNNKDSDNDWFRLESNKDGTQWFGKCWHVHELMKYEFAIEFDIPVTYPTTAPEIAIPELDGKTAKMYRGGKICLTDHFKPLWARNVPKFGIAHAMALGLGPWLAVEIPDLIQKGL